MIIPPDATYDYLADELDFTTVLITSLDPGADDYTERLSELEADKAELERRLAGVTNLTDSDDDDDDDDGDVEPSAPQSQNGAARNNHGDWDFGALTRPSVKRAFPEDLDPRSDRHRSKRFTPDPSAAVTPASSTDSFEIVEKPSDDVRARVRARQYAVEAALLRRREQARADEELARSLSNQENAGPAAAMPTPSYRPNYQTTIGRSGSFTRPPQPSLPSAAYPASSTSTPSHNPHYRPPPVGIARQSSSADIKAESDPTQHPQLVQRHRLGPAPIIDLTSDSVPSSSRDDSFSNRVRRGPDKKPLPDGFPASKSPYSMPGAYPGFNDCLQASPGYSYPAGKASPYSPYGPSARPSQLPGWAHPHLSQSAHRMNNILAGPLSELNRLVNGSPEDPYGYLDDDDLVYAGSRPRPADVDPFNPYHDNEALWNDRYDTIASHDPAKTQEEINALLANIRPDEDLPERYRIQTPESMTVKLKKYQELGLTWLKNCEEGSNKGGILADDMGLGKTIQMLALFVTHKSEDWRCKTTLVVAPVALMRQWKQEIQNRLKTGHRHALTVFIHHGQSKKRSFQDLATFDVVLTTYGSVAAEVKKLESFKLRKRFDPTAQPHTREKCVLIGDDAKWYRVVLDEAQCIKNKSTQTAKGASLLNAKYRFCVTGTPMMNNVEELYSLIHFLRIRPYCEWDKFRMDFSTPLKGGNDGVRTGAMQKLQALCKAIMLRRTKTSTFEGEPILTLPARSTEIDNPVFSDDEKEFYNALEQRSQLQFNKYLRANTVGKSYSAILVLLLRLRQAACHPHLIRDFAVSAAADVTPDDMLELAKQLEETVINRIKERQGNFDCPVCFDASTNPAIFIPCGHDTCSDCFAKLTDPANALANGNESGGSTGKCPNCRGVIDSKRITDYESFKRVHQPELLTADEMASAIPKDDSETESDSEDEDSETESEDDGDRTLGGFIVRDDVEDSETESEAEEDAGVDQDENAAGPSSAKSEKDKKKAKPKKSKKAKGKEKKKAKAPVTLAELKKLASRNAAARRQYLKRLRKTWVSSAKIEKTMDLLKTIMENPEGEKVLVFSQWTSLLDLLEVPVESEGWGTRRYDGSMSARMREDAVDDFRDPRKNVRIMLVSLKAGNAGLNLNMASQVILLDPFWNPYIEEQAIDRAHRLGQTREVKVHRVLVEGTVEDRIVELQDKKRLLISEALDERAAQSIARLGVRELAYLFGVTANVNQDP